MLEAFYAWELVYQTYIVMAREIFCYFIALWPTPRGHPIGGHPIGAPVGATLKIVERKSLFFAST
jgi:hypothetical protein